MQQFEFKHSESNGPEFIAKTEILAFFTLSQQLCNTGSSVNQVFHPDIGWSIGST